MIWRNILDSIRLAMADTPVVIDEIQKASVLSPVIKLAVDSDRQPGRFLLTGSWPERGMWPTRSMRPSALFRWIESWRGTPLRGLPRSGGARMTGRRQHGNHAGTT